jgi:hypothetical protein
MYNARQLAMTRMEEEADQLGGDGVVGVRLNIRTHEWGADMAEFTAIGTAIKHREGALHRAPSGRPFTSHARPLTLSPPAPRRQTDGIRAMCRAAEAA